jgi:ATP-dependent RNA helicase RhlB
MDFQRFGIDVRLAQAAEGLGINSFFYEKMLSHAVKNQENVCAKISLEEGHEEVLLLPALQWILSGESRKALVVVSDSQSGDRSAQAVDRLGSGAGIGLCRVLGDTVGPIRIEGDPSAAVLIGGVDELLAAPELNLRDYGFLVVDGIDRIAELPPDSIHKLIGLLLPSWERRTVLACARLSVKAKNLALELADSPAEIRIDGEIAKAQSVVKETWNVPGEAKLKFLLGLLGREKPARVCVFCNLKDTAEEVSRRLDINGLRSDYILGALAIDRKLAVLGKVKAGDCPCLVLTDQGAEGLETGAFPLIVNFDIPLEPELFVKRLEMLDRSDPGAKVVSLACDRYIYGLPAVESYIDAKLDVLPADEALLSAPDKSEGMNFDRRQRHEDGRRGGRGQQRRDAYSRDAYPREDRSPEIRKSISEATGGTLDMGGNSSPADKPRVHSEARRQQPPRRTSDQDRRGARRPESPRGDSRRGGDRGKQQAPRAQTPKKSVPRSPAKPGPSRTGAASTRNPYDMPIEERMKYYREKYGQGLSAEKQGAPQRGAQKRPVSQRGQSAPRVSSESRSAPPQNKPEGLFGRLLAAFKKKNERI